MDTAGGKVIWSLELEDSKFRTGLATAGTEAKNLGSKFTETSKQIGSGLNSIGRSLTVGLTVPIVGFGLLASKEFGEFDASIKRSGSFVNATAEDMVGFRKAAIEAARGTAFSFKEVADALGSFVGGDVSAAEATRDLGKVIDLALVSKMKDLQKATNLAELALTVFRDDAMDVTSVIDIMGSVAANVTTETDQWANAIVNSAGAAKAAGFSFKELNVIFAAMKRGGADVNLMWAAFNSAMVNVQAPTDAAFTALEGVGISMKDLQGSLAAGPIEFLEKLKVGFEKANVSGGGFAFLAHVLGRQAAPEFALALGLTNEELRETSGYFEGITGTGATMVDKIREAIPALDRIRQSFSEIAIAIGPSVQNVLNGIANGIANVASWFSQLSPGSKEFIVVMSLALAVLGPIVLVLGTVAAAIAFLATPIGLITVAIVAFVAFFAISIAQIVLGWNQAKDQFLVGYNFIIQRVIEPLKKAFGELATYLTSVFQSISGSWSSLTGKMGSGVESIKGLFSGEGLGFSFSDLFGGARATGGPVMPNKAYLVGENGPEMFMPSHAGAIIPNGSGSNSGNTFNFNISEKADWRYGIDLMKRELGIDALNSQAGING
jgi:TP901 family phage tail tape measure protein